MSDTSSTPDQPLIPDAISTEALREALSRGFPKATTLPQFRFGVASKHEGIHDIVLLLTHIFAQDDGPVVIQVLNAVSFLIDTLETEIRSADADSRECLRKQLEESGDGSPGSTVVTSLILTSIACDMKRTFGLLSQAGTAITAMQRDAMAAVMAVEAMGAMGDDTPHPAKRQRLISDEFLDSIGIDKGAFDLYFERRAAD